jgi:hypothetical protein
MAYGKKLLCTDPARVPNNLKARSLMSPISVLIKSAWALVLMVAAVLASGCASLAATNDRPDATLTVSLPLALADVKDVREAFAALFSRELTQHPPASEQGINAWLHLAVNNAPPFQGPVADSALFTRQARTTAVLIVPGMFGDCIDDQSVPFGDGVLRTRERSTTESYMQYADLGLRTIRLVAVPGRMSTVDNGRVLAAAIRTEAASPEVERILLVAYSKGAIDALEALSVLATEREVLAKVKALISVAGPIMGTPVADRFEAIYGVLSPRLNPFACSPSDGYDIASVTRRERAGRMQDYVPATGVKTYSVIAYARPELMAPPLRALYAQLAAMDPRNDGQILASDAILPGSTLLAAARSDHWDVALPRSLHPNVLLRGVTSGRSYPRAALFRALIKWVLVEVN